MENHNQLGHSAFCRESRPDCICTRCGKDRVNGLCGERNLSEYVCPERNLSEYVCPVRECRGFLKEEGNNEKSERAAN